MAQLRALIPSDTVLQSWETFSDARKWAGLDDTVWKTLALELGDENLDSLLVVAGLPPHAVRDAAHKFEEVTAIQRTTLSLAT